MTTTVNVGRAMIQVAASGYSKQILRSDDINLLADLREAHAARRGRRHDAFQ